jgi:5'-nucleotidase
MTNTTAVDTRLQAQICEWAIPFIEFSKQVVGGTNVLLDQTTCQAGECNIGDAMSDAMSWYRGTNDNATITNAGGYHTGDITLGQVLTTVPFGNAIVDLPFSGGDLWKSLEGIVSEAPWFNGQIVSFKFPRTSSSSITLPLQWDPASSSSRSTVLH